MKANQKALKMDWSRLFNLLTVFHIFVISQSSYVQNAKHRIRAEVAGLLSDSANYYNNKQQYSNEFHVPHEYGEEISSSSSSGSSSSSSSRRSVHRIQHHHHQHRNRWSSGHRKSMAHHHFSGWTAWSPCNEECIKRRERYCKLKRKCGITKHLEERKCLHCVPTIVWHQQTSKHIDDPLPPPVPHQQHQQQIVSPSPSIIINAAAAASGPVLNHQYLLPIRQSTFPPSPAPSTVPALSPSYLPPVVASTQETIFHNFPQSNIQYALNQQDIIDDPEYHQYDGREEEAKEQQQQQQQEHNIETEIVDDLEDELLTAPHTTPNSLENEYEQPMEQHHHHHRNQDDYYVLNTKPKYRLREQRNRMPSSLMDLSENSNSPMNEGEEAAQTSSSEIHEGSQHQYIHSIQSIGEHHRKLNNNNNKKRGKSRSPRLRNISPNTEYDGIEGDTFQYEDFDFDPSNGAGSSSSSSSSSSIDGGESYAYANTKIENQSSDSYEEDIGGDYDDMAAAAAVFSRNSTYLLQSVKEKATQDALIPRHRRLYSKWSRWTKCSAKCTTRRYKKCRVREQCGREVLREIAYCYTEGSFCEQWLQAQVQKSSPYELRPITASRRRDISMDGGGGGGAQSNSIVNDYIMNGKGYRGPEYTPMKLKCGIAPMRNGNGNGGKRNMYNMLKIIGGKAARKGEWPWQVAIFNRFKEAFCGGTLIAPEWVLTAAHCVRKVLYVRIGEHNLDYEDGTEMQLRVLKSFKHPNFDKKTVDSDVALLRLPKSVNTTTWIGFSCLPRPYQPLPKNIDCTVIGWGKRRNRDAAGTSILHQAEVPIISMDNCRSVYQDYTITKNMFCAGHKRGRVDTCAGDSGGPLLCRDTTKPNHPWTIFGITSFGDGCAKRNKFGIYAKVPNYVDWVWSVINCNGNCKLHQRYYG